MRVVAPLCEEKNSYEQTYRNISSCNVDKQLTLFNIKYVAIDPSNVFRFDHLAYSLELASYAAAAAA